MDAHAATLHATPLVPTTAIGRLANRLDQVVGTGVEALAAALVLVEIAILAAGEIGRAHV